MDEPWKSLALLFGSAFIAWLTSRLTVRMNIHTEWFKGTVREQIEPRLISLKAELDREQEELRHRLERERRIHEIKFSKVYVRVSDAVERLFELVLTYFQAAELMIKSLSFNDGKRSELIDGWVQAGSDLRNHVNKNFLYFSDEVVTAIYDLDRKLDEIGKGSHVPHPHEVGKDETLRIHNDLVARFEQDARPLFGQLCKKMQEFIGLVEPDRK